MAVYRFPLTLGVGDSPKNPDSSQLPKVVGVMYAGEQVCQARLENGAYVCDLGDEYVSKLSSGRLDRIFIYEPPLLKDDSGSSENRELVSILLVAAR